MQRPIRPETVQELLESYSTATVRTEVRDLIVAGGKILIIGRNSGEAGMAPPVAAVKSLGTAVNWLADHGIDVRALIPDDGELIRRLRNGELVVSERPGGGKFRNRFVVIDLAPFPVVLLLSIGSAKKLDDTFTQPFVHFLARLCADVQPILLFATRIDRLVRHAWAFGEPMTVLEALGGYAGDERGNFVRPSGVEAIQVFFDASNAQAGAETIPIQSRNGQVSATGDRMVDGRVPYGVGSQPPAGIARVRMRAGASEGPSELFLEMPGVLPRPEAVAYGLPEVFDEDGRHVDQVANVMWALSVLGKRDWPDRRVARHLALRKFSTAGLRSIKHDTSAVATAADAERGGVVQSLYRRLDFYETGRLECRSDRFGPIVVEAVLPPGGSWATAADFRRIRRHLATGTERYSTRAAGTFTGIHVEVNGVPARMFMRDGTKYRVRAHGRRCAVPGRAAFTHDQLASAIVQAIADAGDAAVHLVPIADDTSDPELCTLAATRRPIELELIGRRQRLTSLRERIHEKLDDGSPVLTGRLAADVNKEYNALAERVDADERALVEIDVAAERRRSDLRSEASRVRVDSLLDMVASLRNPTDMTYRRAWRAGLHDLRLTVTDLTEHDTTGRRFELDGWLGVGDGADDDTTFRLPLQASWMTGAASKASERVEAIVDQMRGGIPYSRSSVPGAKRLRGEVCNRLGPPGRMLAACDDSRILRIAMAATVDLGGRSNDEIAALLKEPVALVERVSQRFCLTRQRGSWYQACSPMRAALYAVAERDGVVLPTQIVPGHAASWTEVRHLLSGAEHRHLFTIDDERAELVARCECSPDLLPSFAEMVIAEPAGPVCRRCWRDRLGVKWPRSVYEHYVLEVDDPRPRRRHRRRR